MSPSDHTYGPTCSLTRAVAFSGIKPDDDTPPLKTQFFYSSPLPIDDPLTPVPAPSGDGSATKHPPRPFSTFDNNALEEAWLGLGSAAAKRSHSKLSPSPIRAKDGEAKEKREQIVREVAKKHMAKHEYECEPTESKIDSKQEQHDHQPQPGEERYLNQECVPCCKELEKDIKHRLKERKWQRSDKAEYEVLRDEIIREMQRQSGGKMRYMREHEEIKRSESRHGRSKEKDSEDLKRSDSKSGKKDSSDVKRSSSVRSHRSLHIPKGLKHRHSHRDKTREPSNHDGPQDGSYDGGHESEHEPSSSPKRPAAGYEAFSEERIGGSLPSHMEQTGITGSPFQRPPSRTGSPVQYIRPGDAPTSPLATPLRDDPRDPFADPYDALDCYQDDREHSDDETIHVERCKAKKHTKESVDIPVGVSRLHLVQLPALQMKPIYWSPVHDVAAVIRGTWFYRDSMYPVEPAVANQLEMGYRELRPWSQTWADELQSALSIGADGEEKIAHRLWAREGEETRGRHMSNMPTAPPSDQYCAARCFNGEMAAEGTVDLSKSDDKKQATATLVRRYPSAQVVYKDSNNAYILKPTLQPSAYYGRRPLAKIAKGITVGIHVVRGFDWSLWSKKHPEHKSAKATQVEESAPVSGEAPNHKRAVCHACQAKQETPKVTDLVLVIHGIGQKLSERVESFHFTHAINSFRRAVNVELADEKVQSVLRPDLGGIMVLPVNWRSNLSFEDGGPRKGGDKDQPSDFSLKDITPETMPSVRNLISDVMLDIPFYMSHHKPKMIEALVYEANRVYGLWCQNNPDFHKEGRVHIIAHSLGSAMALDVLSKQPTIAPEPSHSKKEKKIHTKHFDFDTKNLFFAGSPAGFFLLLEKGKLLPRRDRNKIGADRRYDQDESITGEAGTFGCLAVDNLYNIMHYNDPITYRLNACVDAAYASSLKNAQVPSAKEGWLSSIGSSLTSIIPGYSRPTSPKVGENGAGLPPSMNRLPSQLEMEVHDFTREEMAENKFLLLNDNGQIDWFLSSGGGPLEIQYLNMLSAHSSYWTSGDFVRLLVTEVGRRQGEGNTLVNMRPVKKTAKEKEKARDKGTRKEREG